MLRHSSRQCCRPLVSRASAVRNCRGVEGIRWRTTDKKRKAQIFKSWSQYASQPSYEVPPGPAQPRPGSIRDRLRQFDVDQENILNIRDRPRIGSTMNLITRVETEAMVDMEDGIDDEMDDTLYQEGGAGLGVDTANDEATGLLALERPYGSVSPRAGDLVEVSSKSWRVRLFAICVGHFHGIDHYYASNGKWFASGRINSRFVVPGFATMEEMQPVIDALPLDLEKNEKNEKGEKKNPKQQTRISGEDALAVDELVNRMQDFKMGPSRRAGAELLDKMSNFSRLSSAIRMSYAVVLDGAFNVLQTEAGDELRDRPFATLDELAKVLFGYAEEHPQVRAQLGKIPPIRTHAEPDKPSTLIPEALYAVHQGLLSDGIGFRPMPANLGVRGDSASVEASTLSCLFAISPAEDLAVVDDVETEVRRFYYNPQRIDLLRETNSSLLPDDMLRESELGVFILKARWLIDHSRKTRRWTPYGTLVKADPVSPESTEAPEPTESSAMIGLPEEQDIPELASGEAESTRPPRPFRPYMWSKFDLRLLKFMHIWAGYERFDPDSKKHWIGSAVLRAIDRYPDAEFLDMATGWTFLQEVGWVTPWDLPSRYSLCLPDVEPLRWGGLDRELPGPSGESLLSEDIFAGKRQEWPHTVYCIDAIDADDIDDGISVERTDDPNVSWLHVHVADPASRIRPDSPLANAAFSLSQTAYLPGHFSRMFPDDIVRARFSLAPGRPCLVFSAKVDRDGNVLDKKITPAKLGPVVFISPDDVSEAIQDTEKAVIDASKMKKSLQPPEKLQLSSLQEYAVGTPPEWNGDNETSPEEEEILDRRMTIAADLTSEQRADLNDAAALGVALRGVRLSRGAMPLYWPRPNVSVSLQSTDIATFNRNGDAYLECTGDPYIRVWYDDDAGAGSAGSRMVQSLMLLAGEVAASWCVERGIPVPFRGQPDALQRAGALKHVLRAHVYPELAAGRRPSDVVLRTVGRLAGADEVTARPVRHVTMGVKHYTKATSPLRRYADMVVHWQIEAVLAEELASGKSGEEEIEAETKTKKSKKEKQEAAALLAEKLPFSLQKLEHDILPMLRVRERTVRNLDNRVGRDQWMLQAMVRGWQGPERETADPEGRLQRLRFTVSRVIARRGMIIGRLDWFDRSAVMETGGLNGPDAGDFVRMEDVAAGQTYPVTLDIVDVHGNRVLVKRAGPAEGTEKKEKEEKEEKKEKKEKEETNESEQ